MFLWEKEHREVGVGRVVPFVVMFPTVLAAVEPNYSWVLLLHCGTSCGISASSFFFSSSSFFFYLSFPPLTTTSTIAITISPPQHLSLCFMSSSPASSLEQSSS